MKTFGKFCVVFWDLLWDLLSLGFCAFSVIWGVKGAKSAYEQTVENYDKMKNDQ